MPTAMLLASSSRPTPSRCTSTPPQKQEARYPIMADISSAPSWLSGSPNVCRTDGHATPSTASGSPMLTKARKAMGRRSRDGRRGALTARVRSIGAAAVATTRSCSMRGANWRRWSPPSRWTGRRGRRLVRLHHRLHVTHQQLPVEVLLHELSVAADDHGGRPGVVDLAHQALVAHVREVERE